MKVFLTGSTGFVGNYVAERLIDGGHEVRALVRRGSEKKLRVHQQCEIRNGDATDKNSLEKAMDGCDAVIHLVGIIREFESKGVTFRKLHVVGTANVADTAVEAGVRRFAHMSALGARPDAPTKYWNTKWEAEQYLRTLDLDLTVFRPSVIIGRGGEFAALLKQMVSIPITPVIGSGENKMQPVAVWNIADFFVRALEEPATIGKAYEVGGPSVMTYNEMLRETGRFFGKKVRLIHFPTTPFKIATGIFERFSLWPITSDQMGMLAEDGVCDNSPLLTDLPSEPASFKEAISHAFGF